jgi:hypothetical protein
MYNENFPKKNQKRYYFPKEMINHFPKEVGEYYPKLFNYYDCIKDPDGFIDSSRYLPLPNDIVYVQIERKGEKLRKIYTAWWTGSDWDGAKISPEDKILRWRKKEDPYDF